MAHFGVKGLHRGDLLPSQSRLGRCARLFFSELMVPSTEPCERRPTSTTNFSRNRILALPQACMSSCIAGVFTVLTLLSLSSHSAFLVSSRVKVGIENKNARAERFSNYTKYGYPHLFTHPNRIRLPHFHLGFGNLLCSSASLYRPFLSFTHNVAARSYTPSFVLLLQSFPVIPICSCKGP